MRDRSAWPSAVKEYLARNVEFAVVHTPGVEFGEKFVLGVGSGCLIGDQQVLTCGEVLDTARAVAKHKRGRVVLLIGFVWYGFNPAAVDESTGLVLCRVTTRNEKRYQEALKLFDNSPTLLPSPSMEEPNWTKMPQIGQEVGFIVPSDGKDSRRFTEFTAVEFCTSVVAHFKRPNDHRILAFATSPVAARIKQLGAPVFSRDAVLLGIISDVEQCEFDAGRRAVVTALFGFPRFSAPKQKTSETSTP
jgi:hypothetical protein